MSHSVIIIDKTENKFRRFSPTHSGVHTEQPLILAIFGDEQTRTDIEASMLSGLTETDKIATAIMTEVEEIFG